jgi:hypothetical protein
MLRWSATPPLFAALPSCAPAASVCCSTRSATREQGCLDSQQLGWKAACHPDFGLPMIARAPALTAA